jgi:DnaJ domain
MLRCPRNRVNFSGPGGVAETVKGMGSFGALIFSPCLIVLSWSATRRWLPERLCKRATTQHQAELRREAARRRQAARQQYAERQRQAEREREQQREAERQREAEYRRTAQQTSVNWWDLLSVSPNASMEEIARSYRRTIQKYHPDRVLGLAPEFLELAENRTKALNVAYDQAKRTLLAST